MLPRFTGSPAPRDSRGEGGGWCETKRSSSSALVDGEGEGEERPGGVGWRRQAGEGASLPPPPPSVRTILRVRSSHDKERGTQTSGGGRSPGAGGKERVRSPAGG